MYKSKKVLILGASSDIGVSTIKVFLKNNWQVTAHYYLNKKAIKKIKHDSKIEYFQFDLKNILKFEKYVLKNKSFFSKFDAFVNLSGYLKSSTFQNFKLRDLTDHMNVNFYSGLLITREVLKGMEKRNWGRIVLSSSIGTKFGGSADSLAYSLSKFINEFFPSYYKKLYSKNITINTLKIGATDTKLHKRLKNKNMKKRVSLIPLGRLAKTDEVANYIYKLCGKDNSLLTGSVINISGGE